MCAGWPRASDSFSSGPSSVRRLLPAGVSAGILAYIYWRVDVGALVDALRSSWGGWLAAALAMVAVTTAITALRFVVLVPRRTGLGPGEAVRLVLAASSLNLILPSKMGDLAKAWFLRDRGYLSGSLGVSLVVVEKAWDMLALLFWCSLGLALHGRTERWFWSAALLVGCAATGLALLVTSVGFGERFLSLAARIAPGAAASRVRSLGGAWREMHAFLWTRRARVAGVAVISVGLWFLHLVQIWFFARSLHMPIPFASNLALAPLAILAGLIPLTFAGVGTRDAAAVILFAPWGAAPVGAALGVFLTLRYLLPAAAGLPFLTSYLAGVTRSGASGG